MSTKAKFDKSVVWCVRAELVSGEQGWLTSIDSSGRPLFDTEWLGRIRFATIEEARCAQWRARMAPLMDNIRVVRVKRCRKLPTEKVSP